MKSLTRVGSLALLLVATLLLGALPAAAGLTVGRACHDLVYGDRKLSYCTQGWVEGNQTRGAVVMHSYKKSGSSWVDSTSQSITLNAATHYSLSGYTRTWGQNDPTDKCRVNTPSGAVTCSVPNTARVTFLSTWTTFDNRTFCNSVQTVSWRDDRGTARVIPGQTESFCW